MRIPKRNGRNFILVTTSIVMIASSAVAKSSRAIEVLSDPHASGRPTVYSVVRGSDVITFKHPFRGNFTRAELKKRTKNGFVLTRFLLSSDGRTYRPVMRLELPFEKHFSVDKLPACDAEQGQISMIGDIAPKLAREKEVIKTKEALVKAGFFKPSCQSMPADHRDAMMMAAAEVFTPDQNAKPAMMLQCLENNGFAETAGEMKARMLQATTENSNPRLQMCCSSKSDRSASFDEKTNCIELAQSLKPERQDYAAEFFHEICHKTGLRSHFNVDAAVDCCVDGGSCTALKNIVRAKQCGERSLAAVEFLVPKSAQSAAILTATAGPDMEAAKVCGVTSEVNNASSTGDSPTPTCKMLDRDCIKVMAMAAKEINSDFVLDGKVETIETISGIQKPTIAQIAEIEQRGPIGWDAEPTQINLTQQPQPASGRAPASIPLPAVSVNTTDTASDSTQANTRPNQIFDTVSEAADRVSIAVTPQAVNKRRVELEQLPARSRGQSFTGNNAQFVTASFQDPMTKIAIATADFSGLQLSFPNPFFSQAKAVSAQKPGATANSAATRTNLTNLAAIKQISSQSPASKATGTSTQSDDSESSGAAASTLTTGTADSNAGSNATANVSSASPAAKTGASKALSTGAPKPNAFGTNSTHANADGTRKIASLGKTEVVNVLVGNYQPVEEFLSNDEFVKVLKENKIQVVTKDNIVLGNIENPSDVFVFDKNLGRLVRSKSNVKPGSR